MTKFFDASERSPAGGWHYFYDPSDGTTMFQKSSPDEVITEVERYRQNNNTFTSREAIEEEVWRYYCSRHPERCGQAVARGVTPTPFLPRDLTPDFFGPIIWKFLNLAAVRFEQAGRDFFLQAVGKTHDLMTCPDCRAHWLAILEENPPNGIMDQKAACVWLNRVHNIVNSSKSKPLYPYAKMVTEFGAPLP